MAPFLVPPLESLTYLIPVTLLPGLRATTALLGGCLALIVRERESLDPVVRKVLRAWAFGAPVGLLLLVVFQLQQFIVRFPFVGGNLASEIVALPRLETCPCNKAVLESECFQEGTLDPTVMDQCWDGSRRRLNQLLWSFAYVLMIGGVQSFLGLLWGRSTARPARRAPAQATAGAERTLFLSYSRQDREVAERLAGDLQEHGMAVWWDQWGVDAGDSLPRKIQEAISQSTWFAVILSPDAIASAWVRAELDLALTREIEGGLTILPLLYQPCDIPLSLRRTAWADFSSSYEEGLELLLRSLGKKKAER